MIDKLNQFDAVKLKSTKNIKFLSGPQGRVTDPDGVWSIVGFVDGQCLIAKQSTIVKVPHTDLVLVATYSTDTINKKIKSVGKPSIDVIKSAADTFKLDNDKIIEICLANNIPRFVESKKYLDKALNKIARILGVEDHNV